MRTRDGFRRIFLIIYRLSAILRQPCERGLPAISPSWALHWFWRRSYPFSLSPRSLPLVFWILRGLHRRQTPMEASSRISGATGSTSVSVVVPVRSHPSWVFPLGLQTLETTWRSP